MDTYLKPLSLSTLMTTTTSHDKGRDRVVTTVPIKFTIVHSPEKYITKMKKPSPSAAVLPSSFHQEGKQQQRQVRFKDHIQCRWSLESDNDRLPRVARRSQSFSRRSF